MAALISGSVVLVGQVASVGWLLGTFFWLLTGSYWILLDLTGSYLTLLVFVWLLGVYLVACP